MFPVLADRLLTVRPSGKSQGWVFIRPALGGSTLWTSPWLSSNKSTCQRRRLGFNPWVWEDSPGGGNGDPLQYSCLENPKELDMTEATEYTHITL